jgi:hypothetical protein
MIFLFFDNQMFNPQIVLYCFYKTIRDFVYRGLKEKKQTLNKNIAD